MTHRLPVLGEDVEVTSSTAVWTGSAPAGTRWGGAGPGPSSQGIWTFHRAGSANLKHFRIEVLDVVDVVVSKLARYNANDAQDIDAMITRGLVPHGLLIERCETASLHPSPA